MVTLDKIKVIIVDDHPLIRKAIRSVLTDRPDIEVVGESGDAEKTLGLIARVNPKVVIMDINLPKMNGIEATKIIKKQWPHIAILILTVHSDMDHVLSALEAGAAGYLTKSIFGDEIADTIRNIVSGARVLSPEIFNLLLKRTSKNIEPAYLSGLEKRLSGRDIHVLKLAAMGMSNKQIADYLQISIRTVKGYLVNIFANLEVASRTEAVMKGLKLGLFSLDEISKDQEKPD